MSYELNKLDRYMLLEKSRKNTPTRMGDALHMSLAVAKPGAHVRDRGPLRENHASLRLLVSVVATSIPWNINLPTGSYYQILTVTRVCHAGPTIVWTRMPGDTTHTPSSDTSTSFAVHTYLVKS